MDGTLYGFTPQPNDENFINYIRNLYGNAMSSKGINLLNPFDANFFHYNKSRSGLSMLDAPLVSNSFIFITRPELNFSFENINTIPFFKWVYSTNVGKMCMAALTDPEYLLNAPGSLNGPNGLTQAELFQIASSFQAMKSYTEGSGNVTPEDLTQQLENMDASIDALGDFALNENNITAMKEIHSSFDSQYKSAMDSYGGKVESKLSAIASEQDGFIRAKNISTNGKYNTPFIPILQNSCTSLSGGAKDLNLENFQYESDYHGSNIVVPTGMDDLWSSGSLTTSHEDIIYGPVSTMFMLWIFYIHYVSRGYITSTRDHVVNRILDYTCSIYHFVLGRDGRTIERFVRYTGCYPKSFPLSSQLEFSSTPDLEMLRKFSITWEFNRYDPMDPRILSDFNFLSESEWRYKLKTWNQDSDYTSVLKGFETDGFEEPVTDKSVSVQLQKKTDKVDSAPRRSTIWDEVPEEERGLSGKVPEALVDGTTIQTSNPTLGINELKFNEVSNNHWGGYPYIKNGRELIWVAPDNKMNSKSEIEDIIY